jgi:Cu/Ag efflux protein CusF
MGVFKTISTACAALVLVASAGLAQDAKTGTITQIDRLNSTIAIQHAQDGTVGAGAGSGAVKQYKVQGASLEALHAGDQVSFTANADNITKIEKQKK